MLDARGKWRVEVRICRGVRVVAGAAETVGECYDTGVPSSCDGFRPTRAAVGRGCPRFHSQV